MLDYPLVHIRYTVLFKIIFHVLDIQKYLHKASYWLFLTDANCMTMKREAIGWKYNIQTKGHPEKWEVFAK